VRVGLPIVDNAGSGETDRLHAKTSETSGAPGKALASVAGNVFLVLGSLVLGLATIVASWVPPRRRWSLGTTRVWAAGLLAASGVRLTVFGTAGLAPGASYVYLANHQSLFDIPALLRAIPGRFRFVAKQSLFRIPVFGWALAAAGFVSVDRGDRTAARQSFAAAEQWLRDGESILVFPEGTRSTTGTLLPFKRGGFLLALRTGLPIVPVGIRGTLAVQPRGRRSIQPGVVEVRFGVPIDAAEYGVRRKRELIREVRTRLAELAGTSAGEADDDESA
jgi:1-acyl-sn-glycerol-3-phosphate acyltransferase